MLIFTQGKVKGYMIAPDETQITGPRLGLRVTSGERERDERGERGVGGDSLLWGDSVPFLRPGGEFFISNILPSLSNTGYFAGSHTS